MQLAQLDGITNYCVVPFQNPLRSLREIRYLKHENHLTDRSLRIIPMGSMTRYSKNTFFHLPLDKI
jgi:hypothetical protein